jgi:hypothetical protein
LEHDFYVSIQLGRIIPTDFHIFEMGWNHQPAFVFWIIPIMIIIDISTLCWFEPLISLILLLSSTYTMNIPFNQIKSPCFHINWLVPWRKPT